MICDVVENGISNADKLLICLAIILLLTIVWTILIGIMFKMREGKVYESKKTNKLLLDLDDDDDDKIVVKSTSRKTKKVTKKTTKKTKKSPKKKSTSSARKTTRAVRSNSNLETYVKVKFYRTKKNLIYVAPENVNLRKGDKVRVRTDEGDIRTATVTQGNYTREKYKTYEYQTLDLVE